MLDIYVKEGCPHCRDQMAEFDRTGVSYQVLNVSSDPAALKKAKEFGASKVPVVVEDGQVKSIGYQGKG